MAWRSATLGVTLTIVGVPIDFLIARSVEGVAVWPGAVTMIIAALLLGFLVWMRRRPSALAANIVFLVDAATVIIALWVSNDAYAHSGLLWIPFEADKLGMVTVAMLAAETWVGIVGICAYGGAVYLQMLAFDETTRMRLALAEPWATTAVGLFSMVLLVHHMRRIALERELARAQAEVAATQQAARLVLAVRDLSNTPLQTIALATALVRERHPDLEPIMRSVDRAIASLAELDDVLRSATEGAAWTRIDESFHGIDTLRQSAVTRSRTRAGA